MMTRRCPTRRTEAAPVSQAAGTRVRSAITKVVVEIDYENGQEPYTGQILGFGDTFEPTLANIDRVFATRSTLTIPTTVAQMEGIGSVADEELTAADILTLAACTAPTRQC